MKTAWSNPKTGVSPESFRGGKSNGANIAISHVVSTVSAPSRAWNHYGGGERKVGSTGFKRAERYKGSRICPRKCLITRLTRFNPRQPALILFGAQKHSRVLGKGMFGRGIWLRETGMARNITGFFVRKSLIFQKVSRFYAQNKAVITRFYAFLRVGPILDTNWLPKPATSWTSQVETFARAKRGRE